MRRDILILLAAVVLMRAPFLNQAVQGDDVYYLLFAQNALADPLHPLHTGFVLQGEVVWGAGHTRPPLCAYLLAIPMALLGAPGEVAYHAYYLLFSLLAALSFYALARRYTQRPLLASFLFLAVPAFVVNGNKLESDIPLLAFWLAGFAAYVWGRYFVAFAALAVAAWGGYQAVFAAPVLALLWWQRGRPLGGLIALAAAPASLAGYQLFELWTAGQIPMAALAGYAESYDLWAAQRKLASSLALTGHLGMLVAPLAVAATWEPKDRTDWSVAVLASVMAVAAAVGLPGYDTWDRVVLWIALESGLFLLFRFARLLLFEAEDDERFLAWWGLVFFGGSVALFYAGSARYLLPMAPVVALLVARGMASMRLLAGATAAHMALGLVLATAEYEYAAQYRDVTEEIAEVAQGRRIWSNAEWGLRHYLGRLGGEPARVGQQIHEGDVWVRSELAASVPVQTLDGQRMLFEREITTRRSPVRLIGLEARSGYSSSAFGVLPFDLGRGLVDRVFVYMAGIGEPQLRFLQFGEPPAAEQLLGGFYKLEDGRYRWMARKASVLLAPPGDATSFVIEGFLPEQSPAHWVALSLDGQDAGTQELGKPGIFSAEWALGEHDGGPVRATVSLDRTFAAEGDGRELGLVIQALGFR